jgi:hypothetical protein
VELDFAKLGGIMLEKELQHSPDYRREVLSPFFGHLKSSESCYVVGAASMGKTRLLDFLLKPDVQEYYLGRENAKQNWLIRVDLNRLPIQDESWAFYELLLSSLLLDIHSHENLAELRGEIASLDSEIIQNRDHLLALRLFELAVSRICQVYNMKLCFLFDEFDEAYKTLTPDIFRQLRAVRDANKYRVSFVLFVRHLPELLRPPAENESFYELLSRNGVGLGPYQRADAMRIFEQIEARRRITLTGEQRDRLLEASGGHAGLIQGLLGAFVEKPPALPAFGQPGWIEMLGRQPAVTEECRKIFEGLSEAERAGLRAFGRGEFASIAPAIEKSLFLKGILKHENGQAGFFCRIFEQYVRGLR